MPRFFALGTLLTALALSPPAHAYVDPGSGTLLLQMLLAAAVGATFYFRRALFRITSLFGGRGKKASGTSASKDDSPPEE